MPVGGRSVLYRTVKYVWAVTRPEPQKSPPKAGFAPRFATDQNRDHGQITTAPEGVASGILAERLCLFSV